jgi:hypothetical protein
MLVAMDISGWGAGPWLVAALVLGLAGLTLAMTWLWQTRTQHPVESPMAEPLPAPLDDLTEFFERPPGSARHSRPPLGSTGHSRTPASGWTALSAPVVAPSAAPAAELGSARRRPIALAIAAVLLLLAAAGSLGIAATRHHGTAAGSRAVATTQAGPATGISGDLSFGGVVLEWRLVGVTVTYPSVRLTSDGGAEAAHVELPTWNCLADAAPADPAAAHCARSVPEFADLRSPALSVTQTAPGHLRISGRFATSTHPTGGSPTPTGRAYDLVLTVEATGGTTGQQPVTGELALGSDSATTTDGSTLRLGG